MQLHLARFEICRIRRGVVVERFRPNLDRKDREDVRLAVAAMRNDAQRWGDAVVVVRCPAVQA